MLGRLLADTGRKMCNTRTGAISASATSGAEGGATALQRLQCSHACPGTKPGMAGASFPGAGAVAWQMTVSGSAAALTVPIGATPSKMMRNAIE
jgi:hypothetical protein